MQTAQSTAKVSVFDLSAPGDMEVRMRAWLSELYTAIDRESGVKCLRVAAQFTAGRPSRSPLFMALPADRIAASETDVARAEAFRLGRIALAGGMPETGSPRPTSIIIPLSSTEGSARSWIECEAQFSSHDQISTIIDRIGLSLGWPLYLQSEARDTLAAHADSKAVSALKSIVSLTSAEGFSDAARTLMTDLADRFKCDRVALGLASRKKIKVRAISHAGKFSNSMVLARRLRAAMEEAFDQNEVLLWPPLSETSDQLLEAQAALAEKDLARSVLTIPLFDGRKQRGAIVFERAGGATFEPAEIETLEALTGVLTPLLIEKRHNDRWVATRAAIAMGNIFRGLFGRRYFAAKLTIASAAVIAVLLVVIERPRSVVAEAIVEGSEARAISAAFDGFLADVQAQEGDRVQAGDLLVQLDDRDFTLERLRLLALRAQAELELDRAISERDRAASELIEARLRQVDAQLALSEQQILRSEVRAPFDALVVSGDLTRSIGRAVSRGETLMVLSPLNEYRVILDAPERDIGKLQAGQTGQLKLSAMPERNFEIEITEMIPVARYDNNATVFSVVTRLVSEPDVLLHGMGGSARIHVDQVPLYVLWGKPLWDRADEWLWRNLPI